MKTNHQWTRINTNRPEDRWTCFNDNWRQNASAFLSRWCDPVMGGSPPGSAGVPPAQILPQLRPSPPSESTGPAGDFSESRPVPFGKLPFACEPGARPPRLGRSIEKDYKWNIDAQDNQDGRLLQETLTRAMIACGFEDVREHKPAVSGKNPVHPVHRCESKIYPILTMNRFPATRRRGLFQTSRAPAPHDGADHTRVKQECFRHVVNFSPTPVFSIS